MLFNTFGNRENPVIIMLAGSFCPAESLEMVYSVMKEDYYVIAPTYNGHYKDSKDFTTRQGEAKEIADYLQNQNITSVKMIYGQSMGSEIGIELMHQLSENNIIVDSAFFDGAPCIKLSRPYKAFMRFKFNTLINMFKGKTLDEAMNIGLVKKFSNYLYCFYGEHFIFIFRKAQHHPSCFLIAAKDNIRNRIDMLFSFRHNCGFAL